MRHVGACCGAAVHGPGRMRWGRRKRSLSVRSIAYGMAKVLSCCACNWPRRTSSARACIGCGLSNAWRRRYGAICGVQCCIGGGDHSGKNLWIRAFLYYCLQNCLRILVSNAAGQALHIASAAGLRANRPGPLSDYCMKLCKVSLSRCIGLS